MNANGTKSSYRPVMLAFSFLIAFILHLLLFCTGPMVTVIMEEMGLSYTQFSLIFSGSMISLIFLRIPWGLASDKLGYRRGMRIALLVTAVAAVVRAYSSGYLVLLLSQFFVGMGLAAVLPCLPLIVKEWAPNNIGLATGMYISGFAAGNATALALTPYLLKVFQWREVLLIYGAVAALICLLWWLAAKIFAIQSSEFNWSNVITVLKDKQVWIILLLLAAAMGSYDTLATWLPKVLNLKQLNESYASLLPVGFFLAGPVTGFILDRFKNKRLILLILALAAAASIAAINYTPFPYLGLFIVIAGFTPIGVLTVGLMIPAEHQRLSSSVASVVGITSALGNLGPSLVPILFGFLMDVTGTYHTSILAVAVFALASILVGSRLTDMKG